MLRFISHNYGSQNREINVGNKKTNDSNQFCNDLKIMPLEIYWVCQVLL